MITTGRHLAEGTLRRLIDEPLGVAEAERGHYAGCALCQQRYAAVAATAQATASLLDVADPRPDVHQALAATRSRLTPVRHVTVIERIREMIGLSTTMPAAGGRGSRRLIKPLGGLAAAACLVSAFAFTPAGSLAQGFLSIFEPAQFTAVGVTSTDLQSLRNLPDLNNLGTMAGGAQPSITPMDSAAAASRASGLTVLTPATLPASVPAHPTYLAFGSSSASFTFSAAKAAASVAATGKALPSMPAGLDGSTLQVTIGPGVVATYGASASRVKAPSSPQDPLSGLPALVVAQAAAPQVASTGVGVATIKGYLVQLPGITASLKAQIEAIGNPESTVPIPVPIDLAVAQHVDVNGAPGLLVGDNTGVGSAMIWQRNHVVYGVAGALSQDDILAVARSLR